METDRLVIIHGETGCGKSSRLPMFIYENAVEQGHQVKIAVTQPRRIAATNLHRRLNDLYGDKVCGLRLGGGVREGEDSPPGPLGPLGFGSQNHQKSKNP